MHPAYKLYQQINPNQYTKSCKTRGVDPYDAKQAREKSKENYAEYQQFVLKCVVDELRTEVWLLDEKEKLRLIDEAIFAAANTPAQQQQQQQQQQPVSGDAHPPAGPAATATPPSAVEAAATSSSNALSEAAATPSNATSGPVDENKKEEENADDTATPAATAPPTPTPTPPPTPPSAPPRPQASAGAVPEEEVVSPLQVVNCKNTSIASVVVKEEFELSLMGNGKDQYGGGEVVAEGLDTTNYSEVGFVGPGDNKISQVVVRSGMRFQGSVVAFISVTTADIPIGAIIATNNKKTNKKQKRALVKVVTAVKIHMWDAAWKEKADKRYCEDSMLLQEMWDHSSNKLSAMHEIIG